MIRLIITITMLILLQACATHTKSITPSIQEDEKQAQMRAVHGDLIEGMIQQGNYHAALAHIEELQRNQTREDKLLLLHAKVLYKLGRITESHADYTQLLGGPYDADAMHGIGLIYAINDPKMSMQYLSRAWAAKPTDPGMRNDYGYALLMQGDYSKARLHLSTAHELAPADVKYRNNALLVMMIMKDEKAVSRVVQKHNVPDEVLEHIRTQALEWQARGTPPSDQQHVTPGSAKVAQASQ